MNDNLQMLWSEEAYYYVSICPASPIDWPEKQPNVTIVKVVCQNKMDDICYIMVSLAERKWTGSIALASDSTATPAPSCCWLSRIVLPLMDTAAASRG